MAGKETRKKREEERSKLEDAGYSLLFDLAAALERNKEAVPQLPETLNGLVEVCNFLAKDADESRINDEKMRPVEKLKSMGKEIEDKSERLVTLENDLDAKGEQIIALEAERERYRKDYQTLSKELDEATDKLKGKKYKISSSASELNKKEKELENAKKEHEKQEKIQQKKMKDLERDLREANRTIQEQEATIKQKSTNMQRLTGSSYSKDAREKLRKVDKEKVDMEERIKDLESELEMIKADKEQNERQMSDELKEKEKTQKKFENDFQVREEEMMKRQGLKDEAIRKLEIDLKVKKDECLKKLKEYEEDLTRIEDDCKRALSENAKEANERQKRIAQLESELTAMKDGHENEKIMLKDEMNTKANKMIAELQTELSEKGSDFEKEKEQLIRKGDEAQQRIAQLQTELSEKGSDFEKEKEQLTRKGDEAQQRIAKLESDLTAVNEYHEKEKQQHQKEIEQKGELMTAHEEHCKNDSPSDSETIHSGCLERIAQLQTELSEKGSDFEKEKQQLTRKGDEAQQRIDELESKLKDRKDDDHEKEKLQLQREIEEKGKLIAKLESERTVTKEDYEKEKLQFQKEKQESGRLCNRLIQERDTLKGKVEDYTKRLASLSEKLVKKDERKVEDTLGLNRPSELEKDINDFFDNERIDACELIQKKYGSEEENDIHIYYPRLACMILETAYEQTVDARTAVVDLFEKMSEWMIVHASEAGRLFDQIVKNGRYSSWTISVDVPVGNKESEHPVDVDGLMLTLKETAHQANLDNFVRDVEHIVYHKWNKWVTVEKSCGLTPSHTVLFDLRGYIQACIRLTWRMVTQVPPMSLKYQSTILDNCDKRLGYHCSQEMFATGQGPEEEIACYLRPGLFDGGERLIRQGEVLCKVKKQP